MLQSRRNELVAFCHPRNRDHHDLPSQVHHLRLLRHPHTLSHGRDEEALSLLGDTKSFFRTTALSHLGQAQRLTGDREAAIKTLRQAVTLGEQLGHHLIMLEALGYLTLLLYQQGQMREAVLLCQRAVGQYTDERGSPLGMAGLVLIPLGALLFEANDLGGRRAT